MPTENRSSNTDGWIACDDGLHLIQVDKNLSHYGWVFRKINGGLPYSVREATAHEMAHAQARQHLRIGVAQIAGQAPAEQNKGHIKSLEALNQQTEKQRDHWIAECEELRTQLRLITEDYRTAIVNGHERITSLGGDCDSVEKMLADNPNYAKARALLDRKP